MRKNKNTIRRNTPTRRPLPILLGLLAVAVAAFILAKLLANSNPPVDPTNSTSNTSSSNINTTKNTTNSTSIKPAQDPDDPVKHPTTQYEGDDPNTSSSLTGVVTHAGIGSGHYQIRLSIDQYLTSGTCHLEFTDGTLTHTDDAPITTAASTSTCQGFDVPLKALGSGKYSYTITITSGDRSGTITGEADL